MKLRKVKVKYVLCRRLGPCQWENKEKMEEDDGEKEKWRKYVCLVQHRVSGSVQNL